MYFLRSVLITGAIVIIFAIALFSVYDYGVRSTERGIPVATSIDTVRPVDWETAATMRESAVSGVVAYRGIPIGLRGAAGEDSVITLMGVEVINFSSPDSIVMHMEIAPKQNELLVKTVTPNVVAISRSVSGVWIDSTSGTGGVVIADFKSRFIMNGDGEPVQLSPTIAIMQVVRIGDAIQINGARYNITGEE